MAAGDLAAKRYAQAAFELAVEKGDTRDWASGLSEMAAFMTEPDIRRVLENTRTSQETKQRLINAGLGSIPPLPLNLARLLVRKGRTGLASQIEAQFTQLFEAREGISHAKALTAVPLSEAEKEAIVQRLQQQTGRRVILETEVDPDLLGGVVVQIGDRLIDASTRARLSALRDDLVGAVQ